MSGLVALDLGWKKRIIKDGAHFVCVPLTTKDMGVTAITQHIKTAKHMKNVDSGEKKTQPKLGQFFVKTEAQSHDVWTVKDLTAKAEIVAAMWFCSGNTSFMTADGLVPCFKHMFPDSKIAQFMSLGSNKMSYLIAYGLGPFFAAQTVAEIKKAKAFFTLHFDETMNAQVKKQMDVLVDCTKHECYRHKKKASPCRHSRLDKIKKEKGLQQWSCVQLLAAHLSQ